TCPPGGPGTPRSAVGRTPDRYGPARGAAAPDRVAAAVQPWWRPCHDPVMARPPAWHDLPSRVGGRVVREHLPGLVVRPLGRGSPLKPAAREAPAWPRPRGGVLRRRSPRTWSPGIRRFPRTRLRGRARTP